MGIQFGHSSIYSHLMTLWARFNVPCKVLICECEVGSGLFSGVFTQLSLGQAEQDRTDACTSLMLERTEEIHMLSLLQRLHTSFTHLAQLRNKKILCETVAGQAKDIEGPFTHC